MEDHKIQLQDVFDWIQTKRVTFAFFSGKHGRGSLEADLHGNYYVFHEKEQKLKTDDLQDAVELYNEIKPN